MSAGLPRTARPGGAAKVDSAQATLLIGPSGWPLPLDIDETLLVKDVDFDSSFTQVVRALLTQLVQQTEKVELARKLAEARLSVVQRLPDLAEWNNRYGKLRHVFLPITVTTQGTAYAASDALGAAFLLPAMAGGPNESGTIVQMQVLTDSVVTFGQTTLYLFTQPIAGTTDNAAFAPTDKEMLTLGGLVTTTTGAAGPKGNANTVMSIMGSQTTNYMAAMIPYRAGANGELYGQLVCGGIPTIAAGDNLYLMLCYVWGYPGMGSL